MSIPSARTPPTQGLHTATERNSDRVLPGGYLERERKEREEGGRGRESEGERGRERKREREREREREGGRGNE